MTKTTKTGTQRYGGYVTRKGTDIIAHFDVTDDEIEDRFAWFAHALEDAYACKKRDTVGDQIMDAVFERQYGRKRTPRDQVKFALVGAISMFLMNGLDAPYEEDKETLAGRAKDFIDELSGFEEDMLAMPRGSLKR